MNYTITDCQAFSPQDLRAIMNLAFSDYVTPMHMTDARFLEFQRQRGFSARHSFAALQGEEIAAFWFSSPPNPRYGNRAYTLSVGTHPKHRRKGLSRRLLQAVLEAQKTDAASGLQLEVVSNNEKAVKAYETFGFRHTRTLRVCKLAKEGFAVPAAGRWRAEPLTLEDLPKEEGAYFDTEPTPQNSRDALIGLSPDIHLAGIRENGTLLGWGAAYADGAVAQIAVHKAHRRCGIGQTLMNELCERAGTSQLIFVNIDEAAEGANAFLNRSGAEDILRQNEMHLEL